jgi:hypothetical protein
MTKRDFYGLFKHAYSMAFTLENIESAWRKAGLQPFNPDVVISQLEPPARPSTGDSASSGSSAYSASNMRKVRRLYKRVAGPKPSRDAQKLNDFVEKMAAENSLLKARVTGLTAAVFTEQKKRSRGKPVFTSLRTITAGQAMIWSPERVGTAMNTIDAEKEAADMEITRKAQEKEDKRLQKKET